MEDDDELEKLSIGYRKGEILSGDMKKRCIEVLQNYVSEFQTSRALITEELYSKFTKIQH